MAAVTRVKARPVAPPGYEYNDKGQAAVAMVAGDLVQVTTTAPAAGYEKVWDKVPTADAGANKRMGIVLMDCPAGGTLSVGIHGEIDGYSGLTPGLPLYASGAVAGGIDTTKPTGAIERMWAVSATRISYCF